MVRSFGFFLFLSLLWSVSGWAGDDFLDLENRLTTHPFHVVQSRILSIGALKPQQWLIEDETDGVQIKVKWKIFGRDLDEWNNSPRREVSAYEFQKLFLEPENYVVPPTVVRCLDPKKFEKVLETSTPQLRESNCVLGTLSAWVEGASPFHDLDSKRLKTDLLYQQAISRFNLLTYFIRHADSHAGNFLLKEESQKVQIYSIDNGVSFSGPLTDYLYWKSLRIKKISQKTSEKLQKLTLEDVEDQLLVASQLDLTKDLFFVSTQRERTLNPKEGVNHQAGVLQFGLTHNEIKAVFKRIESVVKKLKKGKITPF